jgi:uncharacterized protein (DUF2147 family)
MHKLLRTFWGLGAAALVGMTPVGAFADTSMGVFQTTDRKMDYELFACGPDEKLLCVKLTGIRGSADIKRTRAWLDKYIVENAKPAGKNKWTGTVTIQGYTGNGKLELFPDKKFVMSGCMYIVVCQDFTLIPALTE